MEKKVCIIGGGPCGVALGRALKNANLNFDIIEKENDFGGLWNIHADSRRIYKTTHLISCKSVTELSDFHMPQDYSAYPNHAQMLSYIRDIAKKHDLYEQALFGNAAEKLLLDERGRWQLTLANGETRGYDYAILANGLINKPLLPHYKGSFSGHSMHSIEYNEIEKFKGKRVLIVGSGNTGCDIACDLCRYADRVYMSTRRAYHYMPKFIQGRPTQEWMIELTTQFQDQNAYWDEVQKQFKIAGYDPTDFGLPKPTYPIYACHPIVNSLVLYYYGHKDILFKPDIERLDGSRVFFIDGTFIEVDVIIYATGYRPHFPFLQPHQFNVQDPFSETFVRMLHKKYDNMLFFGYFNSPSGLGNLLNMGSQLATLLVKIQFDHPEAQKMLSAFKLGPEPDLGNGVFIHSDRHKYEFDLWKTVKFLRFVIDKLKKEIK